MERNFLKCVNAELSETTMELLEHAHAGNIYSLAVLIQSGAYNRALLEACAHALIDSAESIYSR